MIEVKFLKWRYRKFRWLLISATLVFLLILFLYLLILLPLPGADEIKQFRLSSTGNPQTLFQKKPPESPVRIYVPLNLISPHLQKAVIISEDDLFYKHQGINWSTFWEAFKLNLRKRRYVRGASTLTMQLARNAFLNKRKTLLRKIREMVLARRIERALTKKRILELYLNIAEWGKNIYGAEAAALFYFGKHASQLTLAEATLMAGLLPNPQYFNPYVRPKSCKRMQKRVLWLMKIARAIKPREWSQLADAPLRLRWSSQFLQPARIDSLEENKYLLPALQMAPKPLKTITPRVTLEDTLRYLQDVEP